MAENKKSFVAYADWKNTFQMLTDEEAGKLVKHLLSYVNDENPILNDRLLQMAFEPIKLQLKRDLEKYEVVKEKRSKAGLKSAEIKKQNSTNSTLVESVEQHSTNSTVNDTVTDNVNDTVTVTVIKKESSRFTPPSLLEVKELISEKKYLTVNADSFWNFYESKNWMVGKNKMKDWKKALAGWESRNNQQNITQNGKSNIASGTKQAYEFSVDRVIETYSSDPK